MFEVAIEINAIEPEFLPLYREKETADVKALVPTLNHMKQQALILNYKTTVIVDCGLTVKLPAGYALRGQSTIESASRGLLVTRVFVDDQNKLKVIVTNIGNEAPLYIHHRAVFAQIWPEPLYVFNWK